MDMNDRVDVEDIIVDLTKNVELLKPCLNAPTTSIVIDDTEAFEIPPSSCQNTVTQANAAKFSTVINRRSFHGSSSQEKLNTCNLNVKRLSGTPLFRLPQGKQSKTFIPAVVGRPRSNSVDFPSGDRQSKDADIKSVSPPRNRRDKTKRYSQEIIHTSSYNKYIPLLSNSVYSADQTSDYCSDQSKELYQNITSV